MIEKTIKRAMVVLIILVVIGTLLIKYAFNITFFRQLVIIIIDLAAISIFAYIYFKPEFIIKRRREIFLLILSLVIFFVLMEIILRVTDCGWKWDVSPDGDIKYKYEKSAKICNSIIDGKRFYVRTNNEGFIDDDLEFKEEDYNIFLIGDSYAACLESDYANCAHQKLERDLKEKYGGKINIINFGVSSYSGLAELAVIKHYKDLYKPKMIILYFYVNDLQENQDYLDKKYIRTKSQNIIRKITPKTLLFFFTYGKNLLDKVFINSERYRSLSGLEAQAVQGHEVYSKEYTSKWENLTNLELQVLSEIYKISREENITLLHVAVTAPEQVYEERWKQAFETYPSLKAENYDSSKPNNIIMSYAEENGMHHLDLLPLFRQNQKNLHWAEGHWNDEGQLFAAEKINEYIIENNLIRSS
ncbi:MAG: SGNH/GDSL hydrolase family protein [Nanoarchaeota archaeon]